MLWHQTYSVLRSAARRRTGPLFPFFQLSTTSAVGPDVLARDDERFSMKRDDVYAIYNLLWRERLHYKLVDAAIDDTADHRFARLPKRDDDSDKRIYTLLARLKSTGQRCGFRLHP